MAARASLCRLAHLRAHCLWPSGKKYVEHAGHAGRARAVDPALRRHAGRWQHRSQIEKRGPHKKQVRRPEGGSDRRSPKRNDTQGELNPRICGGELGRRWWWWWWWWWWWFALAAVGAVATQRLATSLAASIIGGQIIECKKLWGVTCKMCTLRWKKHTMSENTHFRDMRVV